MGNQPGGAVGVMMRQQFMSKSRLAVYTLMGYIQLGDDATKGHSDETTIAARLCGGIGDPDHPNRVQRTSDPGRQ